MIFFAKDNSYKSVEKIEDIYRITINSEIGTSLD